MFLFRPTPLNDLQQSVINQKTPELIAQALAVQAELLQLTLENGLYYTNTYLIDSALLSQWIEDLHKSAQQLKTANSPQHQKNYIEAYNLLQQKVIQIAERIKASQA